MKRSRVTPSCCEAAAQGAVFLEMPMSYFYKADVNAVPQWAVHCTNHKYGSGTVVREASFCPFCGSPVPEIERKPEPPKVCVCTDDGYYCDTCGDRLGECGCPAPEEAWRIKR
jgi:hypothetical protein